MKKITFLITALLLYTLPSWSQCESAIALTPGTSQSGNTADFGELFSDNSCLGLYDSGYDALFVYTATETGETMDVNLTGATTTWAGISMSLGCPTGSGYTCVGSSSYGTSHNFTSDPLVVGETYYIHISTYASPFETAYILDTTVIPVPACPDPTALAVSSITTTTASLSWTAGAAETSWEYQVVTAGTTAAESGIVTSDNPLALTGLSSNSSYDVYLRAVCSAQDSSAWITTSFSTQCDPFETFPFAETFDSDSSTSNCWSVNNANADGDAWNTSYTSNTFAGDGVAMMYTDFNSGSNDDWLISPALVLTGNERLKFQQRVQSSGEPNDFEVLLSTTDNLPASFTNVLLANAEYSNTTYQEFIIDLSSFTGASYIAFHVASGGLDGWRLYIDEVLVEEIPATAPGCASNFTDTADENCGNYDFSVSWDTVSGADGYLLTAGTTSGGNDLVDALDLGSSTTYNFSSVIIGQNYFYTVTPYNANGNADGCEEQSVRTAQEGCYCASVPTSNDGTGISSVSLAGTDFTSGGDITYEDFTTTAVSVEQSTTASLSVSYSTGFTYYTNTWVDFNDDYNFDASELVSSGSSSGTLDLSFLVPSTASIGNHRLRIVGSYYSSYLTNPEPCYNSSFGVTIDMTLDVTDPPACIAPSALAASNVTASTADISWSAGGTETAYEYVYQAAGTGEPTGNGTQLTTTSVSLSGMSSNTDYEVYVRSVCDDSSTAATDIANSGLFTSGPAAWPFVLTACTVNDGNQGEAQTMEINITSLPDAGANYQVYKTTANGGDFFGNAQALSLGLNTVTVNAVSFARAVKFRFSSGAVEFDSLVVNGETIYGASAATSDIASSDLFTSGPAAWPFVLTACTVNDGNQGEAQTMEINITSLPDAGANYQVYKTTANGGDFFGNAQALSLGLNTVTVNAVSFARAVKFRFSSGAVEFDSVVVNGVELFAADSSVSYSTWSFFNFTTSPGCGDTLYDSGGASGNYASNELVTVTVYPDVTGDLVTFTFLSFDTESCCDDLTVYDGPSTSSPLVGTYAGSTLPDPITSTDSTGALTFVFDSDSSLQYGGYEILISCGPPPACPAPSALAASNVTASTADISWSAGGTETAYEYVYQAAGTGEPTGAGTQLTTTSFSLSGLSSNTDYEVYVRSACDDGSFSTWSFFNFTTSPGCGDTLYDSGGASGNYASNELVTVTVYPDVTGDLVTFTFLSFDTESCCDDLTVYDGPSTSSPLVGTYAGSTLPDPITSTDSTGALTFVFDSDSSLQYGGYEILISCGPLGIDDYTEMDFTYYPNPVNDQLTIKAQRNVENVTVFNMLGQVVLRQSPNSLECVVNMAEMQTGAYFVRVSIGNTIETVRVLKK